MSKSISIYPKGYEIYNVIDEAKGTTRYIMKKMNSNKEIFYITFKISKKGGLYILRGPEADIAQIAELEPVLINIPSDEFIPVEAEDYPVVDGYIPVNKVFVDIFESDDLKQNTHKYVLKNQKVVEVETYSSPDSNLNEFYNVDYRVYKIVNE